MDGAKTPLVVGILGDDLLTSRILGLLLAGAGYEARALGTAAVSQEPSAALAGVDLVLFVPGIDHERRGELAGAIKGEPATAAVPVLSLSSALKTDPPDDERPGSVLPWPWSVEALVGAIERIVLLAPAPAGGGGGEA